MLNGEEFGTDEGNVGPGSGEVENDRRAVLLLAVRAAKPLRDIPTERVRQMVRDPAMLAEAVRSLSSVSLASVLDQSVDGVKLISLGGELQYERQRPVHHGD